MVSPYDSIVISVGGGGGAPEGESPGIGGFGNGGRVHFDF